MGGGVVPLSHPFRLAGDRAATIPEGSSRLAAELAGTVAATTQGERGLAPTYGVPDPTGEVVDPDEIAAWVTLNEPELEVTGAEGVITPAGSYALKLTVDWAGRA